LDVLFTTVATGTINAINIIYEGLWLMTLSIMKEKVASSKKHTQFKKRVQKAYPIYDQIGPFIATAVNHTLWGRTYKKDEVCCYLHKIVLVREYYIRKNNS